MVGVDTEEEWDWNSGFPTPPFSTDNIHGIPAFQSLCDESGIRPTYFVDQAVVDIEHHRTLLLSLLQEDRCDIGAQLHPWCTPPIHETLSERNSHTINLDPSLYVSKIDTLTRSLTKAFGCHPFSFRCGRWGMNGPLLQVLAEKGYRVDSSIRPRYRTEWFDYKQASSQPYWPSYTDISLASDQRDILELPVSDGYTRPHFARNERFHRSLDGRLATLLRTRGLLWKLGLLRKVSMTPEGMTAADLIQCIDCHVAQGARTINLFLHSSDLVPGNTEYVQNATDLEQFFETLRIVSQHVLSVHRAQAVTMRQAFSLLGDPAIDQDRSTSTSS